MFTTFEKFTDPNGKYNGVFDHTIYFLVKKTGHVITLRTGQNLWFYIPKTFADVLKKDNDKVIFDLLITTLDVEDRKTIYNGMKGNVVRYGLKPFPTEYEYLDNEYLNINLASMQGSTQPLDRFLFLKKLIKEAHTKKLINFNLTDVTGDQRLLQLLPAKMNNFYHLSEFYNDFTNFQVNEKDFSKTFGFQDTSYRFSENEILDIFKVHIMQSNIAGIDYFFDFLSVFKFAKESGVGEIFKDIFYSYLSQNDKEVFTTEQKFSNGHKKNICYIVNNQGQFKFLGKDIEDPSPYGVYHYISETF